MAECSIYEKLQYIKETKDLIAAAIQSQDVEVLESDAFRKYAEYVTQIRKVSSVNGMVGDVTITAEDLGALTEIPSEYITEDELNSKGYLTDIPSNYITEDELEEKGYITSIPSEFVTESELAEAIEGVTEQIPTDLSSFNNDVGYITEIPSEYVTESELEGKGYLTEIPSEYITESELNEKGYITSIPSEYITENELNSKNYATVSYLSAYYLSKNASYPTRSIWNIDEAVDNGMYVWVEGNTPGEGGAFTVFVNRTSNADGGNYYHIEQRAHSRYRDGEVWSRMLWEIDGVVESGTTWSRLDNVESSSDLSNYVTKTELEGKGYITSIPSDYITESELNDKGYITSIPSDYITEEELNNKGYITDSELNDKGFITTIPSEYVTEDDLAQATADKVSENALNEAIQGVVNQIPTIKEWVGTQSEYDALGTYDYDTTYYIIED